MNIRDMRQDPPEEKPSFILIWIGVALFLWLAFGAAFGAAGELGNDRVSRWDIIVLFLIAPIVCLTWPFWFWLIYGRKI